MHSQHFVVEPSSPAWPDALAFIRARQACDCMLPDVSGDTFRRNCLAMSRCYMALVRALGMGADIFPDDGHGRAFVMTVEQFVDVIVVGMPGSLGVDASLGLKQISADEYMEQREKAFRAWHAAASRNTGRGHQHD